MNNDNKRGIINLTAWFKTGFEIAPKQVYAKDNTDEIICFYGKVNFNKEIKSLTNAFKELFRVSFEEGYFVLLGNPKKANLKEVELLFISLDLMNDVFSEVNSLEHKKAFEEYNEDLIGSKDTIENLTKEMIAGHIDKAAELFDILYEIGFIQAEFEVDYMEVSTLINFDKPEEIMDSAIITLVDFLASILPNQPIEKLDSLGIIEIPEIEKGFYIKSNDDELISEMIESYKEFFENNEDYLDVEDDFTDL